MNNGTNSFGGQVCGDQFDTCNNATWTFCQPSDEITDAYIRRPVFQTCGDCSCEAGCITGAVVGGIALLKTTALVVTSPFVGLIPGLGTPLAAMGLLGMFSETLGSHILGTLSNYLNFFKN